MFCGFCQEFIESDYVKPVNADGEVTCLFHKYHYECYDKIYDVFNKQCLMCGDEDPVFEKNVCIFGNDDDSCMFDEGETMSEHFSRLHEVHICRICNLPFMKSDLDKHEAFCSQIYVDCPVKGCETQLKSSIVRTALTSDNANVLKEHHGCDGNYWCRCGDIFIDSDSLAEHYKQCDFDNGRTVRRSAQHAKTIISEYVPYPCPHSKKCHSKVTASILQAYKKTKDCAILKDHHCCDALEVCKSCDTVYPYKKIHVC